MSGIRIYQIYYRREQKKFLDPGFLPWNNLRNRRPDWAEFWVMRKAWERRGEFFSGLTGFLSWKFYQKTGLGSEDLLAFIDSHPGYDCYIFNPLTLQTALFASVWEQGERWHPGLKAHARKLMEERGIGADLDGYVDTFWSTGYCNYFVAGPRFWTTYFALMNNLSDTLEEQRREGTGPWQTTIHDSREYRFVPFLIERCFGIVARLNPEVKIIPYRYPGDKQAERTPGFEELIDRADRYKTQCEDNRKDPAFAEYLLVQRKMIDLLQHSPDRKRLILR